MKGKTIDIDYSFRNKQNKKKVDIIAQLDTTDIGCIIIENFFSEFNFNYQILFEQNQTNKRLEKKKNNEHANNNKQSNNSCFKKRKT